MGRTFWRTLRVIAGILSLEQSLKTMKQLFEQIEQLTPTLPGWCDVNKAQTLAALVIALKPSRSCEIGVYGGRATLAMALAHKLIGKGQVVAIDPWSNDAATEGYVGENREWWANQDLETIYKGFIKKSFELSVSNVLMVMRHRSSEVSIPWAIDLLLVDGQHTEEAERDVIKFAPNVPVGGIVVMDDTGWTNGDDAPVARAVELLKTMGFVSLYPLGTGEVFQRVK
jgi:predicted O-methyltransferase YrrM